jgi:hypothetical protein
MVPIIQEELTEELYLAMRKLINTFVLNHCNEKIVF